MDRRGTFPRLSHRSAEASGTRGIPVDLVSFVAPWLHRHAPGSSGRFKNRLASSVKLRPERLVVEVCDERVHHGTANSGGQHGRRHPGVQPGFVTEKDRREATHDLPERFVVCEEPDDHRVAEEGLSNAWSIHGQVHHAAR